eukprot:CAMPEP_0114494834 /NCGR_PEP_ID=MMETSP0109-20121206/4871_1 /TAXON_ID=29199 /ORGANISM="Chlorarachnion reptans, Strain CCCM449" /LENGTH=223 /DNA_ID=CAMNT_0001671913 /DNA_START=998 /DNA_END=1666 /DNA_ORIENTATION=-
MPLDVLEEVLDDRGGDDVPDVLRVVQRLERDPDHFVLPYGRAAAIPGVYRRVDLDREERFLGVRVLADPHAADDALGHADVVPAGRVPHHVHVVLQVGDGTELQGDQPLPEGVLVDRQDGQVALVSDVEDPGDELLARPVLADPHDALERDPVRVAQNPPAGDDEAGARGGVLPLHLPGQREVRLRVRAVDLHHALQDRPERHPRVRHRRQGLGCGAARFLLI